MTKFIEAGGRLMDIAWLRDKENIYSGEALVLACLLHVRKERTAKQEEELKELFDVFETGTPKNSRRSAKNKKRNSM
jgi:hypothetical protein